MPTRTPTSPQHRTVADFLAAIDRAETLVRHCTTAGGASFASKLATRAERQAVPSVFISAHRQSLLTDVSIDIDGVHFTIPSLTERGREHLAERQGLVAA